MDVEAQIRLWVIKSCDSKLPTVTFPSILAPNKIHENCISGGLRFGVQKFHRGACAWGPLEVLQPCQPLPSAACSGF